MMPSPRSAIVILGGALLAAGVLLAGCLGGAHTETPSSGHSPATTNSTTTSESVQATSAARQPITSRWPQGIETVVLTTETGLYVVDAGGVRWAKETQPQPKTTSTLRGRPVVSGLAGFVVTEQFVAYVDAGEEVVVRSLSDGTTVRRVTVSAQGHTTLRSLSSDGTLLALVSVDPQLEARSMGDEVLWTITVVNLVDGTVKIAKALDSLVSQRISDASIGRCGLVSLHWLPGDKLLVGMSGKTYETYIYDPKADSLELIPGLQYVWGEAQDGIVLGQNLETGQVVVWQGGKSEKVVPDPAWPRLGSGAIIADGTVLVLAVAKTADWKAPRGWQAFSRVGSEWRPAGPTAEVNWMNQSPSLITGDGSRAWTVVYKSTGENHTVLLSRDFGSGKWEEWFRPEDMQVDLGSLYFAAIIPSM